MIGKFWRRRWGKKDYLMSQYLFLLLSVLLLGSFVWALVVTGGSDKDYLFVSCPVSTPLNPFGVRGCGNPWFNSPDCGVKIPSDSVFCTTEFIGAGSSLGVEAPWVVRNFGLLIFFEVVSVLGVNHFLFNKGFFKGEEGLK